jgi:hypothetical protein
MRTSGVMVKDVYQPKQIKSTNFRKQKEETKKNKKENKKT